MRDWFLPLKKILILVFMIAVIRLFHGKYQGKITPMGQRLANLGPVKLLRVISEFSAVS